MNNISPTLELPFFDRTYDFVYQFIMFPTELIDNPIFAKLSLLAKTLYAIFLDRLKLSVKNKWYDSVGHVYIIYQIEDIEAKFNLGRKTVIHLMDELEKFGLLLRKRQGKGLPNLLYLKNFMAVIKKQDKKDPDPGVNPEDSPEVPKPTSLTSEESKKEPLEVSKTAPLEVSETAPLEVSKTAPLINKRNPNNNERSKKEESSLISSSKSKKTRKESSSPALSQTAETELVRDLVRKRLIYENLKNFFPEDLSVTDEIMDIITEVLLCKEEKIVVSRQRMPVEPVKERMLSLEYDHIEYVLERYRNLPQKPDHSRKYLLACLYNAPATIDDYYRKQVEADMRRGRILPA